MSVKETANSPVTEPNTDTLETLQNQQESDEEYTECWNFWAIQSAPEDPADNL